jgi:uncharacterized membrane protein YoaK (UPF0700 family)
MGLTAVAGLHVYTTHVTGTLTALGRRWVLSIVAGRRRGRGSGGGRARRRFLLLLWVLYLLGATAGGWSWARWGVRPMLAPVVALLVIVGIDLVRPIGTRR